MHYSKHGSLTAQIIQHSRGQHGRKERRFRGLSIIESGTQPSWGVVVVRAGHRRSWNEVCLKACIRIETSKEEMMVSGEW